MPAVVAGEIVSPEPSIPELIPKERTAAALPGGELPLVELVLPPRARRRETIGRLALVAGDLTAVGASMLIISALTGARFSLWVVVLLPFFWLLAKTAGLYDRDQFVLSKTTLDEAPALVAVSAIFVLAIEGFQALQFTGRSHPLLLCAGLTCALVAARAGARFVAVRTTPTERVLVIGDAGAMALVKRKLAGDPGLNAVVVGRVSGLPDTGQLADQLLGTIEELPAVLEEHRVERVVVAPTHEGGEDVVDVIRQATACGVRVSVLPRLLEVIGTSVAFDDLGGQVVLGLRGFGLSPSSRFLKRGFDLIVTIGLLLMLLPFLLAVALAVKLSSPGPVLFRQTRIGRNGREFQVCKFRTMVCDADARKHELLERNEAAPLFKIANDPRITRVGRVLRVYSLDELPQLFNVLRGDMSLVGPRPLIVEEDRLFSGWQRRRYHVAPGITGPWQILGSSRVPVQDMLTLDYLYCSNWSLWLDAKILARTIPYVLSRKSGEHQPEQR
jgi:exopolysaccharide biosynthesis polyprenyl glycosylphosphotransferase